MENVLVFLYIVVGLALATRCHMFGIKNMGPSTSGFKIALFVGITVAWPAALLGEIFDVFIKR